jgi:hypothetical protein
LPLPPIAALKLLGALADLAAALVLFGMLKRRGDDPRRAIAWAWSPLAAIELGQDVHVDGLAIAALVGALALARLERPRWALAGLLLGAATGIKLITAPLFGAFRSARGWLAGAALLALGTLPFLGAGRAMLGSSGEFARRWRGNDGLYALVQAATDRVVCRAIGAPRVEVTWREGPRCDAAIDLWPRQRLAEAISGRTYRAAVYPDELSSFLARAATGALLAAVALWVLVRRRDPIGGCELWLGALLLATPALHPWYAAWLLPLVALTRRRAWVALAALIPLGYWPMAAWLAGGPWRDPAWTRVLEHGAAWSLLGLDAVGAIRARRAERREKQASAATPNG